MERRDVVLVVSDGVRDSFGLAIVEQTVLGIWANYGGPEEVANELVSLPCETTPPNLMTLRARRRTSSAINANAVGP